MRRLTSSIIASAILLLGGTSVKADWDNWAIKTNRTYWVRENTYVDPSDPSKGGDPGYESYYIDVYKYNSVTGQENLINSFRQMEDSDIGTNNWKMNQVIIEGN